MALEKLATITRQEHKKVDVEDLDMYFERKGKRMGRLGWEDKREIERMQKLRLKQGIRVVRRRKVTVKRPRRPCVVKASAHTEKKNRALRAQMHFLYIFQKQ